MTFPTAWIAEWIEPAQQPAYVERYTPERDEIRSRWPKTAIDAAHLRPAQFVRVEFDIEQTPACARLYSTAHGVYKVLVNGSRANDHELAPDWTPYRKLLMVQASNLTEQLRPGRNALGFIVADGWWAGRIGMHGTSANFGDRIGLLAQLEIDYPDGSRQIIASGHTFKSTVAEIVYADFLMGEKHDLRLRHEDWMLAGFDDKGWASVRPATYSLDNLSAQIGPNAGIVAELPCIHVLRTPNGDTVLDFGQNLTGRIRAEVEGARGSEISFEYFQTLDADGNCFDNVLAMSQSNRDTVVLAGSGQEVFEPHFSFHGFRYVRVSGYPAEPSASSFTALALSSLRGRTGDFACSDARLNRLHSNIEWTLRSTMLSVPMDNPDRERVGWAGDMVLVARTAMLMFDMRDFLERWLACLRTEQEPDGGVPMVVPMFDGYRDWFMSRFKTCSTSGWGDAAVVVPWMVYQAYGDKGILQRSFDSMVRWLDYVKARAQASLTDEDRTTPARAHLWRASAFHFGDWLAPSVRALTPAGMYDGRVMAVATKELLPTIWYARSASILADVAAELGRDEQAQEYRVLAERIRQSFCATFVRDGRLIDERQGNYVLAAAFDMVPGRRKALADRLVDLIRANDRMLDTGFVSTAFVLQVLADNGHADLALELVTSTEHPSWLYQVEHGATTVWEMWDSVLPDGSVTRTSQIQPALGSVGEWLYEYVAGLRPAAPGYKEVLIEPLVGKALSWARASHQAPTGPISTSWRIAEDVIRIEVALPPGTNGRVRLRDVAPESTRTEALPVTDCRVLHVERDGDDTVIHCPPGDYCFTASKPRRFQDR